MLPSKQRGVLLIYQEEEDQDKKRPADSWAVIMWNRVARELIGEK
jgi:hypothetical protein